MEARMEVRMEDYKEKPMALRIEELVALPIQIAEQLRKGVELEVDSDFKQESANMKKQVDTVVHLLRKAIRFSSSNSGVLYEKPTKLIMLRLTISLQRALGLVNKSRRSHSILKRAVTTSITNNSSADFRQVNLWLESSIGDVTWLLDISATGAAREQFAGLPPIACTEPVLGLIWEQVSTLRFGTPQEKADAASTLGDLAEDSRRNSKIIIQEGALPLLLRLLNIGTAEGQESAAKALGQLARDRECVDALRKEGASFVFVRLLDKHAQVSVKAQRNIAWTISRLASHDEEAKNQLASLGAIQLLVAFLARDTIMDRRSSEILVPNQSLGARTGSVQLIGHMRSSTVHALDQGFSDNFQGNESSEPDEMKLMLKTEAVHALWKLAADNIKNSTLITDTCALLCFAKLIKTGQGKLKFYSIMALMEIAAAAERNQELRTAAFNINSAATKAVVNCLVVVIQQEADSEPHAPCVKALGSLAHIFRVPANQQVRALTMALRSHHTMVAAEGVIALSKFVNENNYLKKEHTKTIFEEGATHRLIEILVTSCTDPNTQAISKLECCQLDSSCAHSVKDPLRSVGVGDDLSASTSSPCENKFVNKGCAHNLESEIKGDQDLQSPLKNPKVSPMMQQQPSTKFKQEMADIVNAYGLAPISPNVRCAIGKAVQAIGNQTISPSIHGIKPGEIVVAGRFITCSGHLQLLFLDPGSASRVVGVGLDYCSVLLDDSSKIVVVGCNKVEWRDWWIDATNKKSFETVSVQTCLKFDHDEGGLSHEEILSDQDMVRKFGVAFSGTHGNVQAPHRGSLVLKDTIRPIFWGLRRFFGMLEKGQLTHIDLVGEGNGDHIAQEDTMDEPRFNFASRDDVVDGAHDLRQTDSGIRGNIGGCESGEDNLENPKDTGNVEHNKHGVLDTSDGAFGVGNGGGPDEPNEGDRNEHPDTITTDLAGVSVIDNYNDGNDASSDLCCWGHWCCFSKRPKRQKHEPIHNTVTVTADHNRGSTVETFVHDEEPANSHHDEGGTSSCIGNSQKEGNVNEEDDDILKFQDNVAIGNHVHANEQEEMELAGGDNLLSGSLEVIVYAPAGGWDESAQLEDGKPEIDNLLESSIKPKFVFHFTKSNASKEISIRTNVRFSLHNTGLQFDDKNQDRFGWFHNNLRMSLGGLATTTALDEGYDVVNVDTAAKTSIKSSSSSTPAPINIDIEAGFKTFFMVKGNRNLSATRTTLVEQSHEIGGLRVLNGFRVRDVSSDHRLSTLAYNFLFFNPQLLEKAAWDPAARFDLMQYGICPTTSPTMVGKWVVLGEEENAPYTFEASRVFGEKRKKGIEHMISQKYKRRLLVNHAMTHMHTFQKGRATKTGVGWVHGQGLTVIYGEYKTDVQT
ncbi:unnamed protein product [Sphagnum compactum]